MAIDAERSFAYRRSRLSMQLARHQGNERPSRKNPPLGPSSGSRAAHNTLAAPSDTGLPPPPMSVAVQPGQTELTKIPCGRNSDARLRVTAFKAALLAEYAGVPPPMDAREPASLDTFTIRPHPWRRIGSARSWANRQAPNTFVSNASRMTVQSAFVARSQLS